MGFWKSAVLGGIVLAAAIAPAAAHTSYLLPNVFTTTSRDAVTIESSFTEDFFVSEIGVDSQDFHVIRPDGKRDAYDNIVKLKQMTILESDLTEQGTYRFTTGERLGRTSIAVLTKGKWAPLDPGETAPKGAKTRQSQTATVAEVYVTKGPSTRQAVDAPAGRLDIHPVTHPSEIYLASGFTFDLLFDGKPLPNQEMTLYRGGGAYEEPKYEKAVKTDAKGRLALTFDKPGIYLVMTRYRADAPGKSDTPIRSYTSALTFEVAR